MYRTELPFSIYDTSAATNTQGRTIITFFHIQRRAFLPFLVYGGHNRIEVSIVDVCYKMLLIHDVLMTNAHLSNSEQSPEAESSAMSLFSISTSHADRDQPPHDVILSLTI